VTAVRVLFEDVIGEMARPPGPALQELDLPPPLGHALIVLMGRETMLTPPQHEALKQGVVTDSAHFLVSAPTNSGKTLIALLRIFGRLLQSGGRYVYVAPLKALAEQKVRELRNLASEIKVLGGRSIDVRISTGDYRVSEDFLDSPPDDAAEILVCTPERLAVMLRNPAYRAWAASVDTYVLDEFHILGQQNRGARYETMVTQLLLICPDSCLLALSATIGSISNVKRWLSQANYPLRLIDSRFRAPRLHRRLIQVPDKDDWIVEQANTVLCKPDKSLLVFVYRQDHADRLAKRISADVSEEGGIAAFHSAMPLKRKAEVLKAFDGGQTRVLVCTTSLAMGINSPATNVIVRDTVFFGHGRLSITDILQMTGRAGRGTDEGEAVVMFAANEQWESLASALESRQIDPVVPRLIPAPVIGRRRSTASSEAPRPLTTALLAEIGCRETVRIAELEAFISHTYSAVCHGIAPDDIHKSVQYLIDEKLAFRTDNSEDELSATKLGRTASHAGLSAESGALFGAFLRAMISLSEKEDLRESGRVSYTARLNAIDFLAICLAAYEARGFLGSGSLKADRVVVDEYIEALEPDDKPLLYLWRDAGSSMRPTRRLMATLRLSDTASGDVFWKLMYLSCALHDYSRSRLSVHDVADKWRLRIDLEGRLVPLVSWLLNALIHICTGTKCYRLDFMIPSMRELLRDLSVGGGLGKLLDLPGVGLRTVEIVREAGIGAYDDLSRVSADDLVALGIRRSSAIAIKRLVVRRGR